MWPEARAGSGGIVSNGADMLRFLLYSMGRVPGGLTDYFGGLHQQLTILSGSRTFSEFSE